MERPTSEGRHTTLPDGGICHWLIPHPTVYITGQRGVVRCGNRGFLDLALMALAGISIAFLPDEIARNRGSGAREGRIIGTRCFDPSSSSKSGSSCRIE